MNNIRIKISPINNETEHNYIERARKAFNIITSALIAITQKPALRIYHLGGTKLNSVDIKNQYRQLNSKGYYYERIPIKTDKGEVFFYGNTLKPFVKEWKKLIDSRKIEINFNEYMNYQLQDPTLNKKLMSSAVRYLSKAEQKRTKVKVKKGRLVQKGLDTSSLKRTQLKPGVYAFVIAQTETKKGKLKKTLFASPKIKTDKGKIQHSSFVRGGNVVASGTFEIGTDGHIESIKNFSGHYRPTGKDITKTLSYLFKAGYDTSKINITYYKSDLLMGLSYIFPRITKILSKVLSKARLGIELTTGNNWMKNRIDK